MLKAVLWTATSAMWLASTIVSPTAWEAAAFVFNVVFAAVEWARYIRNPDAAGNGKV